MRSIRNSERCWRTPAKFVALAVLLGCSDDSITETDECLRSATNQPDCRLRAQVDLPGFHEWSPVAALNDAGEIVGLAPNGTYVVWSKSGTRTLPTPSGYSNATPLAINNNGVVVGFTELATTRSYHLVVWEKSGVPRIRGPFPGQPTEPLTGLVGTAINDRGDIVGVVELPNRRANGFFLSASDEFIMIDGGIRGGASDINESGQVVGSAYNTQAGNQRAFIWTRQSGRTFLPTVRPESGQFASAVAINNHGWVVGYEQVTSSAGIVGFVWRPGQSAVQIGEATHNTHVMPNSINDAGEVSLTRWADDVAFTRGAIWSVTEGFYDPVSTPADVTQVLDINRWGDVIGHSHPPAIAARPITHHVWTRNTSRYR